MKRFFILIIALACSGNLIACPTCGCPRINKARVEKGSKKKEEPRASKQNKRMRKKAQSEKEAV